MLVLTRKKFQRIIIGDSIELKVLEIRGGKVKLGFQCPPEISIRREEVESRPGEVGRIAPLVCVDIAGRADRLAVVP